MSAELRRSPTTWAAALVLVSVAVLALLGPLLAPNGVAETLGRPYDPDAVGWLGTEALGRDVWSRVLHGGIRLLIAPVLITAISTMTGAIVGLMMAASSTAGTVLRALDILVLLPPLVVLLVLLYRFGGSLLVIGIGVTVVSVPYVARYMRAAATPVLDSGWVLQARLFGDSRATILRRDVLPNLAGPILADAAVRVAGTFYVVAAVGFLGFGATAPATDWASMINENLPGIRLNPRAVIAPAVTIACITVPLNLLGDRIAAHLGRL